MDDRSRVVVTGIGIISPIGNGTAAFMDSVRQARQGIRPIRKFDASPFRCGVGGEIEDYGTKESLTEWEKQEYVDPYLQMAVAAARQALQGAGLPDHFGGSLRVGISSATCNGGLRTAEWLYRTLFGLEEGHLDERTNQCLRYYALGRALALSFRIGGPNLTITTACSSSTNALGCGMDLIQDGKADVVLAGGADTLCLTTLSGFSGVKALTAGNPCTPFSGDPTQYGVNLGEGAAFWTLESLEHATGRGATPIGELLGYSLSGDAHHMTAPDPRGDGAYRAMAGALERSGLQVADLGAINAHGTGTEANDRAETKAIVRLLGGGGEATEGGACDLPVSSFKSYIGHCLGAAGIMEATAGLLSMAEGFVPPTLGFTVPRPGCDLDHVPNRPRKKEYRSFMSNSFAFSGNNAALVVHMPNREPKEMSSVVAHKGVVITGVGAVSAFGVGTGPLVQGMAARQSAVGPITRFDTSQCRSHSAAMLDGDPRTRERRLDLRSMNRISAYATLASREAIEVAGLRINPKVGRSMGLVLGVMVGPPEEALMEKVWGTSNHLPDINNFSEIVANSVNGYVSKALYLKGYNTMVASGLQAGMSAVVTAARAIGLGHGQAIISGGCDEVFGRYYKNYDQVGYLARDEREKGESGASLPGLERYLGEGAAMVLMEEEGVARSRGAKVLARVLGWSSTVDSGPFVGGTDYNEALVAGVQQALRSAGAKPEEVGMVVSAPMGNGWDSREDRALEEVFGIHQPARLNVVPYAGYAESCSCLMGLVTLLAGGRQQWESAQQEALVGASSPDPKVLVLGTSPFGNNNVMVLGFGDGSDRL